jgi:hypothetical protein
MYLSKATIFLQVIHMIYCAVWNVTGNDVKSGDVQRSSFRGNICVKKCQQWLRRVSEKGKFLDFFAANPLRHDVPFLTAHKPWK